MELSRLLTAPIVWGITVRKERCWKTKKSARVGLWKRRKSEKSKNRLSRLAWKSRKHRGIPTFPQPRRLLVINLNRTFHLLQKPDILTCYRHDAGCATRGALCRGCILTRHCRRCLVGLRGRRVAAGNADHSTKPKIQTGSLPSTRSPPAQRARRKPGAEADFQKFIPNCRVTRLFSSR